MHNYIPLNIYNYVTLNIFIAWNILSCGMFDVPHHQVMFGILRELTRNTIEMYKMPYPTFIILIKVCMNHQGITSSAKYFQQNRCCSLVSSLVNEDNIQVLFTCHENFNCCLQEFIVFPHSWIINLYDSFTESKDTFKMLDPALLVRIVTFSSFASDALSDLFESNLDIIFTRTPLVSFHHYSCIFHCFSRIEVPRLFAKNQLQTFHQQ